MLRIVFFIAVLVLLRACSPCPRCASPASYLQPVDTTRPYKVDSRYCRAARRDTVLKNGNCIVRLQVFDRRNGRYIHDGAAWLRNATDTTRLLLDNGQGVLQLPAGEYIIDVSPTDIGLFGLSTRKKILFPANTQTTINIYAGSILQW